MFAIRMLALVLAAAALGCTGLPAHTARPQASEDAAETIATTKVGDKTVVGNVDPIPVSGVGLVWKLNGTGSVASGEWRAVLERDLRKKKLPNVSLYLDDPNKTTSLVLVSAVIPPGAKKGDVIDIDISLPRGSGTTSLKGGWLLECDLTTFEESGRVRDAMIQSGAEVGANPVSGNTLLLGKTLVRAEGPLVVGESGDTATMKARLGDTDSAAFTAARIWSGGRVLEERPYFFMLNDNSSRLAMEIAERLNTTFHVGGDPRQKVANALNASAVSVRVPAAYRLNHARFLMVARQVPLLPAGPDSLFRKRLEEELLEPSTAIAAALKLEALGAESQQPLRVALQHESPWVRFAAAEALAYLGNTTAAPELARLAEQHAALRTHCLLALATLDDGVSADALAELMSHPDAQVRYGAFTALRSANERHPALNGKAIRKTFWLHAVAPDSQPMVHVASQSRAEIVLFGKVGELLPPFSIALGREFAVTAKPGDLKATVTRIVNGADGAEDVSVPSGMSLAAIISTVGELGGGYSEAVELVRKAEQAKVLTCAVQVDSNPMGIPTDRLAALAFSETNLEQANLEVERICRGEMLGGSYDLPTFEEVRPVVHMEEQDLNRNPGRLFGPKKHPMDPEPEIQPAPSPPPPAAGPLNREPGRLIRR